VNAIIWAIAMLWRSAGMIGVQAKGGKRSAQGIDAGKLPFEVLRHEKVSEGELIFLKEGEQRGGVAMEIDARGIAGGFIPEEIGVVGSRAGEHPQFPPGDELLLQICNVHFDF